MWKFGITRVEQLQWESEHVLATRDQRISITLYDKVGTLENGNAIAERILFDFADERRAYKRTYCDRFRDFDEEILSFLVNSHPINSIHDVGVSDGRTALDFFERVSQCFPDLEYVASDISGSLLVVEDGNLTVTLNQGGQILEILYHPFVFNIAVKDSRLHYPINSLACLLTRLTLVPLLLRKLSRKKIAPREIFLFAPAVLKKAAETRRFRVAQHNILHPLSGRFDAVRAMNILNPTYFTTEEFETALCNVHRALNPNGVLITGSNEDAGSIVNGAVYIKKLNGFERLRTSGSGSPVDQIICSLRI